MPTTQGPCRFGQYNKMQKIIIKELGYGDVPIIAPGAPEGAQFYQEYDMNGLKGFLMLAKGMTGIFTIDYLNKMLRQTRPFEKTFHQHHRESFIGNIQGGLHSSNAPADYKGSWDTIIIFFFSRSFHN